MKKLACILIVLFTSICLKAQIQSGVYISDIDNIRHELKVSKTYLIHTVYEKSPAKFMKTLGGFYSIEDAVLKIKLEFNSNFELDSITEMSIPFKNEKDKLVLEIDSKLTFKKTEKSEQDLDGQWLFATRGPDTGQERRGESKARKTLKLLMDGRFQWIAYHTETFKFSGTGGGSYTSKDGVYTENIEFFSRDNSRVGASLNFNYEIKGDDWHHTGKNSKGKPMYEIWAKR